jgi:hypothetical protein
VQVVEQEDNGALRLGGGLRRHNRRGGRLQAAFRFPALLHRECRDGLGIAIVKDLKVFLFQVVHQAALLVADDHRDEHPDNVYLNLERRCLRLACLLSGSEAAVGKDHAR